MKKLVPFFGISLFLASVQAMEIPKTISLYDELETTEFATDKQIKVAYYALKAQHDPSRFVGCNIIKKKELHKINKKLDDAYTILSDDINRRIYDRFGIKGIENDAMHYNQGKQALRRPNINNRNAIRARQEKILHVFEDTTDLTIIKKAVIETISYYQERLDRSTNIDLRSLIKKNVAIIYAKLASLFYQHSLYDDAIECINFALQQDTLADESSNILKKMKETCSYNKKRPFAAPATVQNRANKRAKIDPHVIDNDKDEKRNIKIEAIELAKDLFFETADGQASYMLFKNIMLDILPLLGFTQDHHHNPLVRAVRARDYDLTEFFLKNGASPTFRGMDGINGFDALNFDLNKDTFADGHNLTHVRTMVGLLKKYMKPHERYSPNPYHGANAAYKDRYDIEKLLSEI